MSTSQPQNLPCFPHRMRRRNFLATAGVSALAARAGILDFASSLYGDETSPLSKPRVKAVFVRPDKDRYWMGWPGASYDVEARQNEYTKILTEAAKEQGVQLEVSPLPLHEPDDVSALLDQLKKSPPDGVIATVMHVKSWPQVNYIAENRGDIPMIAFSPLGTSFTDSHQAIRKAPKTFVAATEDSEWLVSGMRMLKTIREMRDSRIGMVTDIGTGDRVLSPIGTTLHYVPLERWTEEFREADTSDEMREIAKYYGLEAQDIVEPDMEDLLNAARNYIVARRIMADENCRGISVDCSRLISERRIPCGPCLAWSRLLDEGRVGACEADANAAISQLLATLLLDRPGFIQDPAPNTVRNTLIGSHCTCATRLAGYDQPHEPFNLRSHYESGTGVGLQVLWRPNQEITIMKFQNPGSLLVGTGRVLDNIESSSSGGCRTSVEVEIDNVADSRDVKGHHQLFVYGKFDRLLKAYCQLAGIKVAHI